MNEFDFEISYKKGNEMPADFLSRNVVSISWESRSLAEAQNQDPFLGNLKNFLLHRELPTDPKCHALIRLFEPECFMDNDLLWRRIHRKAAPDRVVIMLPRTLVSEVLQDAHGSLLTGHDGINKTKERILQCYYWPGMDKDIAEHLSSCHKCQTQRSTRPGPAILTPLPQPTEPNQRVHADLFGPLRTSENQKKYILCVTDAFTKYVELVALENKEASTVAEAIFNYWICRHGSPMEIITDQGKEFCNKLSHDLWQRLNVSHSRTTAHHPACNSQAEVANKTIAKYLSRFVDDSTLDWEPFLFPLMFSYNTSFHRSIENTPFFLTFGIEPRTPAFPAPELRQQFYGETTTDDLLRRLLAARDTARRCNENKTEDYKHYYDQNATPRTFQPQQLVLLDEHSFLHKNQKLAPKWSGPHRVIKIKGSNNAELLLRNGKRLLVHFNRLKPYIVPKTEAPNPDTVVIETPFNTSQAPPHEPVLSSNEPPNAQPLTVRVPRGRPSRQTELPALPAPECEPPDAQPNTVRRPRGRPRKLPAPSLPSDDARNSASPVPQPATSTPPAHTYALRSRGPPTAQTEQHAPQDTPPAEEIDQIDTVYKKKINLKKLQAALQKAGHQLDPYTFPEAQYLLYNAEEFLQPPAVLQDAPDPPDQPRDQEVQATPLLQPKRLRHPANYQENTTPSQHSSRTWHSSPYKLSRPVPHTVRPDWGIIAESPTRSGPILSPDLRREKQPDTKTVSIKDDIEFWSYSESDDDDDDDQKDHHGQNNILPPARPGTSTSPARPSTSTSNIPGLPSFPFIKFPLKAHGKSHGLKHRTPIVRA
jgi:hypothetical protein